MLRTDNSSSVSPVNRRSGHWGGKHTAAIVVMLFSLLLIAGTWIFRQPIADYVRAYQYEPTPAISAIVERTTMSDYGRRLLFASDAEIVGAPGFSQICPTASEKTATILGCYTGQRIIIYDVTNAELDGIRDVTAAHEMLHAAYDRLDGAERQRVDSMLETEYSRLRSDQGFVDRVKLYDTIAASDRPNELHSIIGTEVASISSELEAYYARYFHDRGRVVKLQHRYARVFMELKQQADSLVTYLNDLSREINSGRDDYNKRVSELNRQIESFNARASTGELSSSQFAAERQRLVSESDALDVLRTTINQQSADYEAKRAEYLTISAHVEELNRSIDSKLAPAPRL